MEGSHRAIDPSRLPSPQVGRDFIHVTDPMHVCFFPPQYGRKGQRGLVLGDIYFTRLGRLIFLLQDGLLTSHTAATAVSFFTPEAEDHSFRGAHL